MSQKSNQLRQVMDDLSQILVASADDVGSNQLQNNHEGLRGDSVVLKGKKTLVNTGLDPSQTSFFQGLDIPTKINKGTGEIKLDLRPFSYDLNIDSVWSTFNSEDLICKFALAVSIVTSLSLAISYPTIAAASHMFINAYKNALAIAVETEYSFPQADKVKEYLAHPSKFAGAATVALALVSEDSDDEPMSDKSDDDLGYSLFVD